MIFVFLKDRVVKVEGGVTSTSNRSFLITANAQILVLLQGFWYTRAMGIGLLQTVFCYGLCVLWWFFFFVVL